MRYARSNTGSGSRYGRLSQLRYVRQLELSVAERHAAPLVRRVAAARCDWRSRSGVVPVTDVREEQDLLEALARIVESPGPLSPELFGAVEHLARETTPPPLATSLSYLRRLLAAGSPAGRCTESRSSRSANHLLEPDRSGRSFEEEQ